MQDGTRIRACAASSGFRSKPRIEAYLEQARETVETLDAQSEEPSSRQAQAGRERGKRERLERLESALKEFDKLKASKSRVERVSTSDADARVMKQAEGGSAPSYNVQISTDAANSLIVDIEVTQAGSDYQQLKPAMERLEQTLHRRPNQVVVDGGYISSGNIAAMAARGIDLIGPSRGATHPDSIAASRTSTGRESGLRVVDVSVRWNDQHLPLPSEQAPSVRCQVRTRRYATHPLQGIRQRLRRC